MSCDMPGVLLEFPNTGTKIAPYKLDLRQNKGELAQGKAEISTEAGKLIEKMLTKDPIPVDVRLDEELEPNVVNPQIMRMALDADSLTYTNDIAWLGLRDPRVVFLNGQINWEPAETNVHEALQVIHNHINDPNGVFRNLFTTQDIADDVTVNPTPTWIRVVVDAIPWYDHDYEGDTFGDPLVAEDAMSGALRFRNVTPLEALREVEDTFGLDAFLTETGQIRVAHPGVRSRTLTIGEDAESLTLDAYNISHRPVPYTSVTAKGTYKSMWKREDDSYVVNKNGAREDPFQAISAATYDGDSRDRPKFIGSQPIDDPKALEQDVINELHKSISDTASGTLVIDGLSSKGALYTRANTLVGDFVLVGPHEDCSEKIEPGIFWITGFNHSISSRGWKITLTVSRAVDPAKITAKTRVMGRGMNSWVDADEFYGELWD